MAEAAQDLHEAPYPDVPGIRWTHLSKMRISPLHYRHAVEAEERKDTQAMRIGRAAHTLTLEPHAFDDEYVVAPADDRRTKAYKDFAKAAGSREILMPSEYDRARAIADAVHAKPRALAHISGEDVQRERVIQWTDPDTGLGCKAKVDTVNGHLVELKTSHAVLPDKFSRVMYDYAYHGQCAWYLDGLLASGFELQADPAIIMAESDAPYDVVPYVVPPAVIDKGRELYKHLLQRVVECERAGWWPGVAGDGELTAELPPWAYDEQYERIELGF